MLNINTGMTRATDMVADCSRLRGFDNASRTIIFSNAFFEHLYRQQLPLLRDYAKAFKSTGPLCFWESRISGACAEST